MTADRSTLARTRSGRVLHLVPVALRRRPHVAVVVPCFNYGRFLPAAVGSVLAQPGVDVSVVVVDDASTDDSLEVARSLAAADPRVQVIAHESNRGPVETFNDGLAAARGDYLVRLDADDLLTPGSLARAVAVGEALPDVGLVYGHPVHFHGDPPAPRRGRDRASGWTVWPGTQWLADRCADGTNVITSPEVVMRMSVVERVGGQQPLAHTHDMEMWFRIAAFADVAYVRGCDQALHREHADSLSARKVDDVKDLEQRLEAFEVLFAGVVGGVPGAAVLRSTALRAVALRALEIASHRLDRGRASESVTQGLAAVALRAWPEVVGQPAWARLQRRLQAPGGWSPRRPAAVLASAASRVEAERAVWRWERHGVYGGTR